MLELLLSLAKINHKIVQIFMEHKQTMCPFSSAFHNQYNLHGTQPLLYTDSFASDCLLLGSAIIVKYPDFLLKNCPNPGLDNAILSLDEYLVFHPKNDRQSHDPLGQAEHKC